LKAFSIAQATPPSLILGLVTNNSFVDQVAFDGMRKHLTRDFSVFYHLDLQGNVRHNPTLSGTAYNVFGIQVGVGVSIAVRSHEHSGRRLFYHAVPVDLPRQEKLKWLRGNGSLEEVKWARLQPDSRHTWLQPANASEFSTFLPIGSKEGKAKQGSQAETAFKVYSGGIKTNRDRIVYDFDSCALLDRIRKFVDHYNAEVDRFKRAKKPVDTDSFVDYSCIKWDGTLKAHLEHGRYLEFREDYQRSALYRPFSTRYLYFDRSVINSVYLQRHLFPRAHAESENLAVCASGVGAERPFAVFPTRRIPDLNFFGPGTVPQWYPFYVYDEDGSNRRENVTDWALKLFRKHYTSRKIDKWDVFYYVYGMLHHPGYRAKFADCLKRELPRIPLAVDFWAFANAGRELADWHLNYDRGPGSGQETANGGNPSRGVSPRSDRTGTVRLGGGRSGSGAGPSDSGEEAARPGDLYPLEWVETPGVPLSYRVEKMKLSKDKTAVVVNDSLTLRGVPPEAFEYRLGNRSALDWVIDQYKVSTHKRSGITSDPNRPDDPEYIVRLVQQVVRVSVETVRIVKSLPADYGVGLPQ